ncbi:MAG: malonyl CoA-acyl carrier protein transacylase, partial [Pseudomonadota bacterium]
ATVLGMGASRAVECGPGKVLGGLLRRIDRSIDCQYLETPDGLRGALAAAA